MVKKRNHVLWHYGRLWNLAHLLRFGSNMSPEPRSFLPPQWVSVILTSAHPCPYLVFLHHLIWKRKGQWTILEVPFEKKFLHIHFSVNIYAYVCLCKGNYALQSVLRTLFHLLTTLFIVGYQYKASLFLFVRSFSLYLFIYFWLYWVSVAACKFSLVVADGGYSSLPCTGFWLRWLLFSWGTGSRHTACSTCSMQAQ